MLNDSTKPNLLVFSDDWGRHPSSCQHLIRRLLNKYPVYWVNTIGTRRPRLDWATVKRACERIQQWTNKKDAPVALPNNLRVLTPKMWPSFSSPASRKFNRELLHRQLSPLLRSLSSPVIAITTIPIVADLVGVLPVDRWVYYCVDDFGLWPGLDRSTMQEMEVKLIERANRAIVVSETLQEKLERRGKLAPLLTHGVDLDFWSQTRVDPLPQLQELERPLFVFWGVVDRRMDLDFLRRLSSDLSKGTIVLVGPEADPDPELQSLKRIFRLPPLPYHQLPGLAQETSVLIMPYADLPVTRAMQPLKLKEYLATGKPAVIRDLPANKPWADSADLVSTPEEFSKMVQLRVQTGLTDFHFQNRLRLQEESWEEKARQFEHWVLERENTFASVG